MDPENTQTIQPAIPVQPVNPPVPPVPTTSRSKLPIILGVIILVLVSVGILLAKTGGISKLTAKPTPTPVPTQIPTPTPTPDLTADWKTYINNKYSFQLKYPPTLYSCNLNNEDKVFILDSSKEICPGENGIMPPNDAFYSIHIDINTGTKSQADFITSWQKANFKATPETNLNLPLNSTSFTLEKIQAAPGPNKMIIILTPLKDSYMTIQVNDLSLTQIAYQILSTFKFTN